MSEHWIENRIEVGRCTYCLRVGRAENLKKMPREYRDGDNDLGCEYCPDCYPDVLVAVKNQPWNRDK